MSMVRTFLGMNTYTRKLPNLSEKDSDEFSQELLEKNISRDQILSCIVIVISSMLMIFRIVSPDIYCRMENIRKILFTIYILMLLVPVTFLVAVLCAKKFLGDNAGLIRGMHLFLNAAVLIMCAVNAVASSYVGQQPFSYVIAMFAISSMVLFPHLERYIIYGMSYIVYTTGVIAVQKDISQMGSDIIFTTLLMIVALIVSNTHYSLYVSNFINHKKVVKTNQELDVLYRSTEEILKKRTEELCRTMEYEKLRTIFFANISHELRTPLTLIFSAEQMLEILQKGIKEQDTQHEIKRYTKLIRQNCYRLIRLISNLIDITKIDAGYFKVEFRNCDIVRVVEDITLSVSDYIEGRDITLTFDTEVEEKVIKCDPDKIERIMLNLLSNAVKFTPKGGRISVNIYDNQEYTSIYVQDTGAGIPETMKELIFDRFVQVDRTITRNKEGSGIGLSLVKALVDMHNGSISVVSEEGKGSTFIVKIPNVTMNDDDLNEKCILSDVNEKVEKINIEFSDIYLS